MENYAKNSGFWSKTKPRVMGDFIGRPDALSLLGHVKRKLILEAGVGTGYLARILAQHGAEVFGCDKEPNMLRVAIEEEQKSPLGIDYVEADIIKTPYVDSFFDAVLCIGVLIHNDADTIRDFFKEALRVLKPYGVLVVSVTHPFLFVPGSPSRNGQPNWVRHTPESPESGFLNYRLSQIFIEDYRDINGQIFTSKVWHHSIETYLNAMLRWFHVECTQEVVVDKSHLLVSEWGTQYGYPAFFQMRGRRRFPEIVS